MLRTTILAVLVLVLVPLAVAASALGSDDPLQQVKAATARYNSIEQAEKDGYVRMSPCISSPAGGMGFHYENAALMADPAIDPLKPEILVYAPKRNGRLELVAVEYWKRDADQLLGTTGDRPSLFGRGFDGPMPGHNPAMPVHYDLHVWLYEDNPRGLFAPFNPNVSC